MATAPKPKTAPTVTDIVSIDFPMPARTGGAATYYNFDGLDVGQSFGVKDRDKKGMQSAIGNANRKYQENETDANGNPVYEMTKMPDGTQIPNTSKPKRKATRHFVAIDVTPEIAKAIKGTPLEGSKVIVKRDK